MTDFVDIADADLGFDADTQAKIKAFARSHEITSDRLHTVSSYWIPKGLRTARFTALEAVIGSDDAGNRYAPVPPDGVTVHVLIQRGQHDSTLAFDVRRIVLRAPAAP